MEFSKNQIEATNPVAPIKSRNFTTIYYLWWSCYPSISSVLIAKKVPAEIDKNIASATSPYDAIIQPNPIESAFKTDWIMIKVYDNFFVTFLDL